MKIDLNPAPISAFPGRVAGTESGSSLNTSFNWIFNKGERQYGDAGSNGPALSERDFAEHHRDNFWNRLSSEGVSQDSTESAQVPELCDGMDSRPRTDADDATEVCDGQDSRTGVGSGDTTETCDGKDGLPKNRDGYAMETHQDSDSFSKQAGAIAATLGPWDASAWMLNFYLNRGDGVIRGGELLGQSADGNLPFNANQLLSAAGKQDAGDTLNSRFGDRAWR